MCKAVRDIFEEGQIKGRETGRKEGVEAGREEGIRLAERILKKFVG